MRITATVPDELGKAVKEETDNVSAFVAEALEEKLARERQQRARKKILELAGKGKVDRNFDAILREERRSSGRV